VKVFSFLYVSGDLPNNTEPLHGKGHRHAVAEAAETGAYNRRMKELAAEDEARREGLVSRVFGFFLKKSRRY
jgi:hypothetical protein